MSSFLVLITSELTASNHWAL